MVSNISPISISTLLFLLSIVVSLLIFWEVRENRNLKSGTWQFIVLSIGIFAHGYIISSNIIIALLAITPVVVIYIATVIEWRIYEYERRKRKRAIKKRIK